MLEKTLESPLDSKKIKPVNPKGNQSWIFFGRTETEVPILWPLDAKNWLIGKGPDAGKDWRQKEKGITEDEKFWIASWTQWTWVWASLESWWWTGKPGVHGVKKRVQHHGVTELNWLLHLDLQNTNIKLSRILDLEKKKSFLPPNRRSLKWSRSVISNSLRPCGL